jgi:hypothetical protein
MVSDVAFCAKVRFASEAWRLDGLLGLSATDHLRAGGLDHLAETSGSPWRRRLRFESALFTLDVMG